MITRSCVVCQRLKTGNLADFALICTRLADLWPKGRTVPVVAGGLPCMCEVKESPKAPSSIYIRYLFVPNGPK